MLLIDKFYHYKTHINVEEKKKDYLRQKKKNSSGAVYLDLPATLLKQRVDGNQLPKVLPVPEPPLIFPDVRLIEETADLILRSKKPLIITGKGSYIHSISNFLT